MRTVFFFFVFVYSLSVYLPAQPLMQEKMHASTCLTNELAVVVCLQHDILSTHVCGCVLLLCQLSYKKEISRKDWTREKLEIAWKSFGSDLVTPLLLFKSLPLCYGQEVEKQRSIALYSREKTNPYYNISCLEIRLPTELPKWEKCSILRNYQDAQDFVIDLTSNSTY